jgi:chromosome segregation ATPase
LADQLKDELERATARNVELESKLITVEIEKSNLRERVVEANEGAAGANARADELRTELNRAQKEADQEREARNKDLEGFQEQRKAMAAETLRQAERLVKAQEERDQAREGEARTREEAAGLRGRLEALESGGRKRG